MGESEREEPKERGRGRERGREGKMRGVDDRCWIRGRGTRREEEKRAQEGGREGGKKGIEKWGLWGPMIGAT